MDAVWSRKHSVVCVHPGWGAVYGRDEVMGSWHAILSNPDSPAIRCDQEAIHGLGDTYFVTCVEHIGNDRLMATNLFALEDGHWRLVHHHAGPIAAAFDLGDVGPPAGSLH